MGKLTRRTKLHIWIACIAILLNVLTPSISHALSSINHGRNWIEVCTVDGTKVIAADQAALMKSPLGALFHHLEHCPFCVSDASAPPLPGLAVAPFAIAGAYSLLPGLYYRAPAPLFSYSQSNPRAPPASA